MWQPSSRRANTTTEIPVRDEVFEPHTGLPSPGTCTRETSPHDAGLWKPGGLKSRRAWGLQETETLLLKHLGTNLFVPSPSAEAAAWKAPRLHKIYWLTLGHVLKEQESGRTFSRDKKQWRAPFFCWFYFSSTQLDQHWGGTTSVDLHQPS